MGGDNYGMCCKGYEGFDGMRSIAALKENKEKGRPFNGGRQMLQFIRLTSTLALESGPDLDCPRSLPGRGEKK